MRKLLCCLLGLAVVVFALPAIAGNDKKLYSLDMEIVSAQPPFSVSAKVTNQGNSTINSFQLFVTGLTVTGVTQPANGTATFTGSSVSVKNMHPLKSGDSVTVTIAVNSCGDGEWSAAVWTGSSLNGQTFGLTAPYNLETSISCGDVGAGGDFDVPNNLVGACVIAGDRGAYDKDGSPPNTVSIFVTNTIPSNGRVHFRWPVDNSGDPAAAFIYTVTCPGPLPPTTYVAWFNTDGTPSTGTKGTPDFISVDDEANPLDCLPPPPYGEVVPDQAILPAPYGMLIGAVGTGDTFLRVDTTGGAVTSGDSTFDIVVGTGAQTERMTVNHITCEDGVNFSDDGGVPDVDECGETGEAGARDVWLVTRAVGGTTAQSHIAGAPVMYTPLPIMQKTQGVVSEYKQNNQAQMCVVDQGYDSESNTHFTTFIDIGDGHLQGP
jgi:hypothetical protein